MTRKGGRSRWTGARYSSERQIERIHFVRNSDGSRRRKVDTLNEVDYCSALHEGPGFHRGARVRATHGFNPTV